MNDSLQLVMQDLEHGKRRKKKSVLSKLAGSSTETSPRCVVDSLDSVGDDRTSQSDDYGLEGSRGSESNELIQLKQRVVDLKNCSNSDLGEAGVGDLNGDAEEEWNCRQNSAGAKKMGLDDLIHGEYSDNDDGDGDGDDDDDDGGGGATVRWRPESTERLNKHDMLSRVHDLSPKQSPILQQQQQALNGDHDISDSEDEEDGSELEETGALAPVAKYGQKSTPPAAVLNLADEAISEDETLQAESTSTFASAVTKVFSLFSRTQAPSESSIMSGYSMTKISTKDARNRFLHFCFCYTRFV